jgi:hypothetical protein
MGLGRPQVPFVVSVDHVRSRAVRWWQLAPLADEAAVRPPEPEATYMRFLIPCMGGCGSGGVAVVGR